MPKKNKRLEHIHKIKRPKRVGAKKGEENCALSSDGETRTAQNVLLLQLQSPQRVHKFNEKWDLLAEKEPDIAKFGIVAFVKKYYKAEDTTCTCTCVKCSAAIEGGTTAALKQITSAQWSKMKASEKALFVESHGSPVGLIPNERDSFGRDLIQKGAFAHPLDSGEPPEADAIHSPHSPDASWRPAPWGSRVLEENISSRYSLSPMKHPVSQTRSVRMERKIKEAAATTEPSAMIQPFPFNRDDFFPDFGRVKKWTQKEDEGLLYALEITVKHRVFRYEDYVGSATKAKSAIFVDKDGVPFPMFVLNSPDWHSQVEVFLCAVQLRVLRASLKLSHEVIIDLRERMEFAQRPRVETP